MYITRELEYSINDWLNEREIIAIIGPRQCGKTTLIKHIRSQILERGEYDSEHLTYISFDDEIERLKFEENYQEYIDFKIIDDSPHIFFLDEVQYLENAGNRIKVLFDKYHTQIKFIITGSSSLDIKNIGGELVGRVLFFELYPFSFSEFLSSKDTKLHKYYLQNSFNFKNSPEIDNLLFLDKLNQYMKEYIMYGGYPRIVLMEDTKKKEFLLRELVTTYIEKDILKVYGNSFRNDALKILQYLAFHCCQLINYEDISSHFSIDIRRVNEVVNILEDTFLIKLVRPYHNSLTTELRKRPKTCFMDNGFRNTLAEDFHFSNEKGFLFENFVFTQLHAKDVNLKYWRTTSKAEVDFIFQGIPIEVKITPKLTRSLQSYLSAYFPPYAIIANFNQIDKIKYKETLVHSIPACILRGISSNL